MPDAVAAQGTPAAPSTLANNLSKKSKLVAGTVVNELNTRRSSQRTLYRVEAIDVSGKWDDADWCDDDQPLRFNSIAEAKEEIRQFVADAKASGMQGYSVSDFRIVPEGERRRRRRSSTCAAPFKAE